MAAINQAACKKCFSIMGLWKRAYTGHSPSLKTTCRRRALHQQHTQLQTVHMVQEEQG